MSEGGEIGAKPGWEVEVVRGKEGVAFLGGVDWELYGSTIPRVSL